jgi:GTP-binding protein HflX
MCTCGGIIVCFLKVKKPMCRDKMTALRKEIESVRKHRQAYRRRRKAASMPAVALVGYTNAGKSTLINALTAADVHAADVLFATLDPTTRKAELPSGTEVLISDTVGFVQKLPTQLIAAFRATLEEIKVRQAVPE